MLQWWYWVDIAGGNVNRIRRAVASGIAVITATAGLGMAGASPASADTVVMNHTCAGIWTPGHTRVIEFTITAPATASPHQTVTVTVNRLVDRSRVESTPVEAGHYRADALITLGGAASGRVTTNELTSPALQAGENWRVENGTVRVTMPAAGEVTYQPDTWRIIPHPAWQCWPKAGEPVPVAARTLVR